MWEIYAYDVQNQRYKTYGKNLQISPHSQNGVKSPSNMNRKATGESRLWQIRDRPEINNKSMATDGRTQSLDKSQ